MDVLADVMRAISLKGALFFDVHASDPWISMNPSMDQIGSSMMPDTDHVIPFHIILEGNIFTKLGDDSCGPVSIGAGDVLMLPTGGKHIITSDLETWEGTPADVEFYKAAARSSKPFTMLNIGENGDKANLICGYLGCDKSPFNPLVGILPNMLVLKNCLEEDKLMRELVNTAVLESKANASGSHTMVAKLSELMFLRALRQCMDTLDSNNVENWLTALKDKHIGQVLELIHNDPTKKWSLDLLSKSTGMSSSSLSERFHRFVGEPPMSYLARWRMELAGRLLKRGQMVEAVAHEVGYSSESAFQRSFKKIMGTSAGQWRKQ